MVRLREHNVTDAGNRVSHQKKRPSCDQRDFFAMPDRKFQLCRQHRACRGPRRGLTVADPRTRARLRCRRRFCRFEASCSHSKDQGADR